MSITGHYWASVDLTLKVTRPSLELLVISRALSRGQRLLSYQECTTCCRFSLPCSGAWVKVAIAQGGVRGEGSWPLGWGHSPPPFIHSLGRLKLLQCERHCVCSWLGPPCLTHLFTE